MFEPGKWEQEKRSGVYHETAPQRVGSSRHLCANSTPSHGGWSCRTRRKPGAAGPAASELFTTHAGPLPSACLPPLPGRSLAVCKQSSGIKLARPLLFPHPHWPKRVHQGLALILILFKRGERDSAVSSEAIYTPPLATAPTLLVWCAIKSINRKFLQGKPDCCSIRERRTGNTSPSEAVACPAHSNPVT